MSQKAGETMAKTVKCWVRFDDGMPVDFAGDWGEPHGNGWVEMTGEVPAPEPEQPERTCEIRWDEQKSEWMLRGSDGIRRSGFNSIRWAVSDAQGLGYRVANDPREVVLEQGPVTGLWHIGGTSESGIRERMRGVCRERGWRILREEPFKEQPTPGPGPDEVRVDEARRMVSSLLNAMSANPKAELGTIAVALRCIERLLSHEPESRTPV
jgi:hypothetical protein